MCPQGRGPRNDMSLHLCVGRYDSVIVTFREGQDPPLQRYFNPSPQAIPQLFIIHYSLPWPLRTTFHAIFKSVAKGDTTIVNCQLSIVNFHRACGMWKELCGKLKASNGPPHTLWRSCDFPQGGLWIKSPWGSKRIPTYPHKFVLRIRLLHLF